MIFLTALVIASLPVVGTLALVTYAPPVARRPGSGLLPVNAYDNDPGPGPDDPI